MDYQIKRSNVITTIIVCDVEKKLLCPIERKNKIIDIAEKDAQKQKVFLDKEKIAFTLSIPTIEDIYCFEKETTAKVLRKLTKKSSQTELDLAILANSNYAPQVRLKMGKFILKENLQRIFFSQLQFEKSDHDTVKRLVRLTKNIFENKTEFC